MAKLLSSVKQLSGKVYPDRSFSIGVVPRKQKLASDREYDKEYEEQYDSFITERRMFGQRELEEHRFLRGGVTPRRFIKSPKSSQKRGRYGTKGISRNGKRIVKNCCVLLERKYSRRCLGFVTATIPTFTRKINHYLAMCWSEIVRRFFQKIKRKLEKRGYPVHLISCTEIQEKRFKKTGVVYPHLHFVYVCKERQFQKGFSISASEFRQFWQETIEQMLDKIPDIIPEKVDYKASIDAQVIKKSAAAYLGKYMSKGGKILEEIDEKGLACFLPKQWWTATSEMKKWLKDEIIILDSETSKSLMYQLGDWLAEGVLTWCNYISIEINGEDRIVGCVGVFSEEHYYLLRQA